MTRRTFIFLLPGVAAGARASESQRRGPANGPLYIAFRSASDDRSDGWREQANLRQTVEALRQAGHAVQALTWGSDYSPVQERLNGTCRLPINHFPAAFTPIVADWLRDRPDRHVCIALGGKRTFVRTPDEALRLTSPWQRMKLYG